MFLRYKSNNFFSILLTVLSVRDVVHSALFVHEIPTVVVQETILPAFDQTALPKALHQFAKSKKVQQAFGEIYQEINAAAKSPPITDFLKYEEVPNPHQLSLEGETGGSAPVEEISDLKTNAKKLLEAKPRVFVDNESFLKASQEKTEAYQKLLSEANGAGNYGFVLNGEGPDLPSTAAYISLIKKPPQGIFLRPRNKDPIANIQEFNLALEAMEHEEKYGKIKSPLVRQFNDELYLEFAQTIKKRIEETGKPFNLVVFGSGEPIVKLMAGDLKEFKDKIIFSHITPYFWQEKAGTKGDIRWRLGSNVSRKPEFEGSILDLGVQRLAIHAAASKLQHFSNIIDREEAGLRLTNEPDVNLNDSGAIAGLKAYFSPDSPSDVGRRIGAAMKSAFEHNSKQEISEQELAMIGHKYFQGMSEDVRRRVATVELMRTAFQLYVKAHPEVEYKEFKDSELTAAVFWEESGLEKFEEACDLIKPYLETRDFGAIPKKEDSYTRDLAHWAGWKPMHYDRKDLRHRQLMVPLIAMAERDGKLTVHIHASEGQAIITAIGGDGGEKFRIPFFGVPVTLLKPQEKLNYENFNLKLDPAGSTVVVTDVDQKQLLRVHEAFVKLATTNIHMHET